MCKICSSYCIQLLANYIATAVKASYSYIATVEPVYYGHLGTDKKCPDYQGVLIFQVMINLYDKAPFGTIIKCVDCAGVLIFKCPD